LREWIKRKIAKKAANLYLHRSLFFRQLLYLFTVRDKESEDVLDEVFNLAIAKGFVLRKPEIRKLMPGLRDRYSVKIKKRRYELNTVARAIGSQNLIITTHSLLSCGDKLLIVVSIAHELGHIVDYQTRRKGHKLFDKIRHCDTEMFAYMFAAYLTSKLAVMVMQSTYNDYRFNIAQFLFIKIDC